MKKTRREFLKDGLTVGISSMVSSPLRVPSRKTISVSPVGIANSFVSLTFDRLNGTLTSIRNLASEDEYLKNPGREGNPFRLYVDTTEPPPPATDPSWWSGQIEGAMGGRIVDAADCKLIESTFQRIAKTGELTLTYHHPGLGLRIQMEIHLPDDDDAADCVLTVRSESSKPHSIMTAFPHLSGIQLGQTPDTNLGLMLASYGTPGVPAWTNSGGFYGRETSMQWQAVYEPTRDEGFGFIVMDPNLLPKLIRRFAPNGMSVLYLPAIRLLPEQTHRYPPARLIIHRGDWRVVARRYGDWFRKSFKLRRHPSWLGKVDLYTGPWIPSPASVANAKEHPGNGDFTSFRRMPDLYLADQYDLKEWAQYNDGVRTDPSTYGPFMADGIYNPRLDLGGAPALKVGVDRLHKIGRHIIFYIAGNSVLKDSPVLHDARLEDWMLMNRPGQMYEIGYPNGISVCPGYKPWQEILAKTAKRLLAETGADGIRLDELATFVPCFNPTHRHLSPFDSNQWLSELVQKVRAAMDEVNRDAILCTETPIDYLHQYTNAALQMFSPGRDIDAMRVAIPSYIGFAYHPGEVESALNGWIGGKTTARRDDWPWTFRGVHGQPAWYQAGIGPYLRWHELRASFPEAVVHGEVTLDDPQAMNAPHWVGRIWKGRRYWLMIGGNLDASPLGVEARIRLPMIPTGCTQAYEFDAVTLEMRDAHLLRDHGVAYVTMKSAFGAVLLPLPHCPPLIQLSEPLSAIRTGATQEISVTSFAPWRQERNHVSIQVECPALDIRVRKITLPNSFQIHAPIGVEQGYYPLYLSGDCLPLKRWINVSN